MDAAAALGGWDLATEVAARTQPDTWIEAYPHGVSDHGDIGGDSQAGDAHGRRFVRWVPAIGLWAVINDAFYLAACDHDADDRSDTRCPHCGPTSWIEHQTEFILCRDFRDPGGTEVRADYEYDNTAGDFDHQITDEYARHCASRLRADAYGDPAEWRS